MSEWRAEWESCPDPSTPGTVMSIEFRDGQTLLHTITKGEHVRHDGVGVHLTTIAGAGRNLTEEHRTYVWHDINYFRFRLVTRLKVRADIASMYHHNMTWHVEEEPTALRFENWDEHTPCVITVMDGDRLENVNGVPAAVVAIARAECGR